MNKPHLMIHEIRDWMFKLPLKDYILTFDDGLYSQYFYLDKFLNIPTKKIFFISSGIICDNNTQQSMDFPSCQESHQLYFESGDKKNYMNWQQIKHIASLENCSVGGHSHRHLRYESNNLKKLYDELELDTNLMIKEFESHNIVINDFCFPYNKEYFLYKEILKKHGINKFYGDERINIEDLI